MVCVCVCVKEMERVIETLRLTCNEVIINRLSYIHTYIHH